MKLSAEKKETESQFNGRIAQENEEAKKVPCPLVDNCGAEIGEPCCTQAGHPRIRHDRRLVEARKVGS